MYTVSELDMLETMITYFDKKGDNELSEILKLSTFEFLPQYEFTGIISNQRKLYGKIHAPIDYIDYVNNKKQLPRIYLIEVYV